MPTFGCTRRPARLRLFLIALLATALPASAPRAAEVDAAVAANFTEAAKAVAQVFEAASGDHVVLSFGSTGQLYTQVTQGAPFDVFLSADRARPEKAEREGYAVPGSRFTYAVGRIVLFGMDKKAVDGAATLTDPKFSRLAIANPV